MLLFIDRQEDLIQRARMHIMKKININLMGRYLLLLDRFVDKLSESGFEEKEIIEQSYLFCAGFYIKYQSEIEKLTFSNREVVLSFCFFLIIAISIKLKMT